MAKSKIITVNNLIALCNILDDFERFSKDLTSLITTKYNGDIIHNLYRISKGKNVNGCRKIKRFYSDNKLVVDTINRYSNILSFIDHHYDCHGNLNKERDLNYFYKYLKNHQDELDMILCLLERIKELDFNELQLAENEDFTNSKYHIYKEFGINSMVSYLDNIDIIPNYQDDVVEYQTTGSNYKIVVTIILGRLSKNDKNITVNSLVFNPDCLPKSVTKETIFDTIIDLKSQEKDSCVAIQDSVNLSVGIEDLYSQFISTSKYFEKLDGINDKEELHKILLSIKSYLEQLKSISSQYDENILQNKSNITKEMLQEEKTHFLQRRYWENIDLD